ncbi:MAG: putative lipoprotein [Myxococcaceae bacterium]|nr:putative lipoprotein [Myxococcaceae bacterium]
MRKLVSMLALGAALTGCGADNALSGSVSELFPLTVSSVEVLRNDYAFQVTYYANRGTFLDVVARIVVSTKDIEMKRGVFIKLDGESEKGHQRTSVAHAPGGEAVRTFPNVKLGDMVISELGVEGLPSKGNFSMSFEATGGDLGQGRTLVGTFSVPKTKDAGYGPLP